MRKPAGATIPYLQLLSGYLRHMPFKLLPLFLMLCTPTPVIAQSTSPHGFLSFNAYPYLSDVNSDSNFTFAAGSSIKNGFSYFGFTNLYNVEDDSSKETTHYFTEQNLRWRKGPGSPWELTYQANFRTGANNDRHRVGIRWHLDELPWIGYALDYLNIRWAVNVHAIQFDHDPANAWQIEHSYSAKFPTLSDRLYLAGFIDHAINETLPANLPSNPIVSETQLGYRLVDEFYLIAEYRINQYRRSDVNNLAVGLEYKIRW